MTPPPLRTRPTTSLSPRPEPRPPPSRTRPVPSTAVPLVQFRELGVEASCGLDALPATAVPSRQKSRRGRTGDYPHSGTILKKRDRTRALQAEQQFLALQAAAVA